MSPQEEPLQWWVIPGGNRRFLTTLVVISWAVLLSDAAVRVLARAFDSRLVELLPITSPVNEANLPTWWNTALLLLLAWLLLLLGSAPTMSGRGRRAARGLTALVLLLSLDEATAIHERLGPFAQSTLDRLELDWPTYAWVIPGAVLAVLVLAVVIGWGRALPGDAGRLLVLGFGVYFFGAVVLEAVGGMARSAGLPRMVHYSLAVLEEGCEMTGVVLAMRAPLESMRVLAASVTTRPDRPSEGQLPSAYERAAD